MTPARHGVLPLSRLRSRRDGRARPFAAGAVTILLCATLTALASQDRSTRTTEVTLKLKDGGSISGLVVDDTDEGIVIVRDTTPYVFAWSEVETGSAYVARRELLAFARGGRDQLSADDHHRLGLFVLSRARPDLASREFRLAARLDSAYDEMGAEAFRAARDEHARNVRDMAPPDGQDGGSIERGSAEPGLAERVETGFGASLALAPGKALTPAQRARVMDIYRAFGETVRAKIYKKLSLVETDHFLIWTDWADRDRDRLGEWCEAMYAALCKQFGLDASRDVFLAKCPVFCWRSPARFRRFAEQFDGTSGINTAGYTRSIESNGHVHMAILRRGRDRDDFDRFAATLVHEGTHAFLHRLHATRLIPHWVNEGYAEWIAERVLQDRCAAGEKATLLARQYVRYDWPISRLLAGSAPIGLHQYPLAHSVVDYLVHKNGDGFARFIINLKDGGTLTDSLSASYDGLTPAELENDWREAIRRADTFDQVWTRQ